MKDCPVCSHQNFDDAQVCVSCTYNFSSSASLEKTSLTSTIQNQKISSGNLIGGRYKVVHELGRGGMGVVYLVQDTGLGNREVALKMIHPQLVSHPEASQRFEQEVAISLELLHPSIVRVHHLDKWEDHRFFTMEYIPGKSLRELIDEKKSQGKPFSLEETLAVINPLLDALSYAHHFTIHRDIKPENIIVQGEFPNISIKVLDFGIAKTLSASKFTQTAQSMGTAYYMAPEQMIGAKKIDPRADLYSVGMILYEMLTLEMAVGRFDLPSEIVSGLSTGLDSIVGQILRNKPEERFSDAQEVKQVLLNASENLKKEQQAARITAEETGRKAEAARKKEETRKAEEEKRRKEEERERAKSARKEEELHKVEAKKKRQEERQKHEEQERRKQKEEKKKEDHKKTITQKQSKTKDGDKREKTITKRSDQKRKWSGEGIFIFALCLISLVGYNFYQSGFFTNKNNSNLKDNITKSELVELGQGRLLIKTKPELADVKILNTNQAYSPHMPLNAGKYQIKISQNGYETLTKLVEVKSHQESRYVFNLKPYKVRIFIDTVPPKATVKIANPNSRDKSYKAGMKLEPGQHYLKVPEWYQYRKKLIEVLPGQDNNFKISKKDF